MRINKIEAGYFSVDGGAAFGVVPKRVWQKRYPCDKDNFCKMAMRCLLIETDNRLILVDTGTGTKQLEYLKYYNFGEIIDFETELNKLGYTCADVTDVVQTHLHFDHCGGGTYYADKGKTDIRPTFPNADFWVGKRQWQNFLNPNVREDDSYFPENMRAIEAWGKLKLIGNDTKLCDEVELRLFDGHTTGQIAVYINYYGKTILFVGDIIPFAANIPIAWLSAYDCYPVTSMEDKTRLLNEAAKKSQILVFQHDAYTECAIVANVNGRVKATQTLSLEEAVRIMN
jgi:glyoxylase-like metal-dependent hydrolase (beta-lactamase superfamily II)